MGTAPVKAIALAGANLEFQSHVPFPAFAHAFKDSHTHGRRGFGFSALIQYCIHAM